ncbi:lysine (K)-specific demethylase 4B [Cordyceps fumosorosea ARSEF 2679]|uniref:Lysine (K)-specific demethylase 4B n=1 Tax=Cordyceps fumosorosea (strain ARSEF 2679) TaxID=1081104 RepID=A0A167S7L8_CORFA|nr:lysine (K)-specific demethylase 4B [Cordyceps fumosorosea ARSEF 2679]OAA59342.1 lysine (K)-specific demethylase 4B [Cordyceps fumosorosea ARSEF 2679]
MATAILEWPAARPETFAEAYEQDGNSDDDVVDLVKFPVMETQEPLPIATATASTTAFANQDVDSATSTEESMNALTSDTVAPSVAAACENTVQEANNEEVVKNADSTEVATDTTPTISTTPPPPATILLEPPNSAITATSSDMNSPRPEFSSPLQQCAEKDYAPATPLSDISDTEEFAYDYDESSGHRLIRLCPTAAQWDDFPALLAFARKLGACDDGCFKLKLPADLRRPLPRKPTQTLPANAYKAKQIRRTTFWQLSTIRSEGEFYTPEDVDAEPTESVEATLKTLKTIFRKNMGRQMRNVRYRPDVPAWNSEQRRAAGVPADWSPIHPLRGDMLDHTKAVIPGIHTPYVYESAPQFGATFQIHAEDYRLLSLNHLYRGRKIWIVVPCTAIDLAERALGRGTDGCSQFMRHRAEFFFPEKLEKLGIPYRIVDQRPGETIVVLPDAYHEGYSTGYTLAEAKNYADNEWSTETYKPCAAHCQLLTAIPPEYLRPLADGEERLDLCALQDERAEAVCEHESEDTPAVAEAKRRSDDMEADDFIQVMEPKRVKVED